MMCQCVFYTTKYKQELLEKFTESIVPNELTDILKLSQDGDVFRIEYPIKEAKVCADEVDIIETSAHVISDIVQKEGITEVTKNYLSERKDLTFKDKKEIEKRFVTNNYLSTQEGFSALTYYLIYMPVLEALKEHQTIHIDGWLKFRTHKYKVILEDILEEFIEDFLLKKDIVKFINMVREMSQLNDPLEDTVHLIYKKDGEMHLLNEYMEEVTDIYLEEYCKELLLDSTLNKEDLIMNILITICPRKIVVHQKQRAKHPQFIRTLEGIFGVNIKYCKGCRHCKGHAGLIKL